MIYWTQDKEIFPRERANKKTRRKKTILFFLHSIKTDELFYFLLGIAEFSVLLGRE